MPNVSRKADSLIREQYELKVGVLVQVNRNSDDARLKSFFGVVDATKEITKQGKKSYRYKVVPVGVLNQEDPQAVKVRWYAEAVVNQVIGVQLID